MKILFLTTQFPYPLDNGGKIGAYNGISILCKNNELTVLSFSEDNTDQEGIKYYKEHLPNVKFCTPVKQHVHIQKRYFELCKVLCKGYMHSIPYIAMKFENKEMYRNINKKMGMEQFDLIFIDYLSMYSYGQYIIDKYPQYRKKVVFKDHNIEFRIFQQAADKSKGLKKVILNHEWKQVEKYEKRAVIDSEMIFTVCDEDAAYLSQYNVNIYTMKPTFDILPERKKVISQYALLYIGNLSWQANINGLKWFFDNVWPILLEKVPDITIDIIGGGLKESPFSDIKGVNYRGYLKDICNIYEDFKVFVVPLFEGSGIRIKILEAFNHNIAVVSTAMACKTIGAQDNREIMIADMPEQFAEHVITLLENEEKNNRIRNNAKQFLLENYSLTRRQEEINELISSKFNGGGAHGRT